MRKKQVTIYTDGASLCNPGFAGAGIVWIAGEFRKEIGIFLGEMTNNQAELTAVKIALEKMKRRDVELHIHTDSEYVIGVLTGSLKVHKNTSLVWEIRNLLAKFSSFTFHKVLAHSGVEENELADSLASQAAKEKSNIGVDVVDFAQDG